MGKPDGFWICINRELIVSFLAGMRVHLRITRCVILLFNFLVTEIPDSSFIIPNCIKHRHIVQTSQKPHG